MKLRSEGFIPLLLFVYSYLPTTKLDNDGFEKRKILLADSYAISEIYYIYQLNEETSIF